MTHANERNNAEAESPKRDSTQNRGDPRKGSILSRTAKD